MYRAVSGIRFHRTVDRVVTDFRHKCSTTKLYMTNAQEWIDEIIMDAFVVRTYCAVSLYVLKSTRPGIKRETGF